MTPTTPPPSEERLRLMVKNNIDKDIIQGLIDKHKLPYIIIEDTSHPDEAPGGYNIRSAFTAGELWLRKFITVDDETKEMLSDVAKMANSPHEVLIIGETGTGKELIAKAMIGNREGSIKSINCAGLPRELMEAELFGYKSGSFTGASNRDRDGLMTMANDGLLFMDEIGELPLDMQAKLLRAIQDKTIRKVGATNEERINCKFVFATNRDISDMVEKGTFRKDLYARISTLEIHIKPLRERKCDIIPILKSLEGGEAFIQKFHKELEDGLIDISLNVRSLQQHTIRYQVLGRLKV